MATRHKTKETVDSPAFLEASPGPVKVRELRQALGLNRRVFSRLTGFSERAVADWEGGKALSEPTRQRMVEVQRLQQGLARVMKPEYVGQWLQTPNDAFGGLKPIEVVERGEIDRLWRMINYLESGHPA